MKNEFSSGVIVYRTEGKRLLMLFLGRDANSWWDIPKGHIEKGDSDEQAAVRETWEEAGIKVRLIPYFRTSISYTFLHRRTRISKRVTIFLAQTSQKRIRISYEHSGYAWMTFEQAIRKAKFRAQKELLYKVFPYIQKIEAMKAINLEYSSLPDANRGWVLSRRFVPGEGPLNSRCVVVGQAPGQNEDNLLRPFIGRSGKLLDLGLGKAGVKREDAYITSAVQFFPPGNRVPSDQEIRLCSPFLKRQLDLIAPKCVLLLGNIAAHAVLGSKINVTKERGIPLHRDGRAYLITFHPAAVLRFKRFSELFLGDIALFAKMCRGIR